MAKTFIAHFFIDTFI